jgi:hypothetical protein
LPLDVLKPFLGDGGPWYPAAESGPFLAARSLRYVKIKDGSSLSRVLVELDGQLLDANGGCKGNDCLPITIPDKPGDPPDPRHGATVVVSAIHHAAWVFGGVRNADGVTMHDAWSLSLDSSVWRPLSLPPSIALGEVLAGTYSAQENVLYVLDEVTDRRHLAQARLLRLSLDGAVGSVVASWPRVSPMSTFALGADPSGVLWLVASGGREDAHVVARLRCGRRGVEVLDWRVGAGVPLPNGFRVEPQGASLVVQRRGHRPETLGYRSSDMHAGPGGDRACF